MSEQSEYKRNDDGALFIPATKRPDGTWRKPRRVKEGYIPQEEMPLYESKGKKWAKSRMEEEAVVQENGLPSKSALKNARRRERKKQQKLEEQLEDTHIVNDEEASPEASTVAVTSKKEETSFVEEKKEENDGGDTSEFIQKSKKKNKSKKPTEENPSQPQPNARDNPESTDITKRLRNLRKKLKEVESLQEKIKSGAVPKPDSDQLKKVARKKEMQKEIEKLEAELK